jgi:hypothetical protein
LIKGGLLRSMSSPVLQQYRVLRTAAAVTCQGVTQGLSPAAVSQAHLHSAGHVLFKHLQHLVHSGQVQAHSTLQGCNVPLYASPRAERDDGGSCMSTQLDHLRHLPSGKRAGVRHAVCEQKAVRGWWFSSHLLGAGGVQDQLRGHCWVVRLILAMLLQH